MKDAMFLLGVFIVLLFLNHESAIYMSVCFNLFSFGSMFYVDKNDNSKEELYRVEQKLAFSSIVLITSFISIFYVKNIEFAGGMLLVSCIPVIYLSIVKENVKKQLNN